MRQAEAAKTNWLTLLRNGGAGDGELGAGLVRLATLAAAVHQAETARLAGRRGAHLTDDARADGSARGAAVAEPVAAAADRPSHTEVRR